MQLAPDIFTLLKEYGFSAILMAAILYFFYKITINYIIKTVAKYKEQHDIAIEKIVKIESSLVAVCEKLKAMTGELSGRCKMEECRYLDEIVDLCKDINGTIHQFTEDAKVVREETKNKINDVVIRVEEGNRETREVSQSLLGLVRSFLDKKINE